MNVREWMTERAVAAMLQAYPADFRSEYAREIRQLVRDRQCRDGETGVRFWSEMLVDVARSAPTLHLERLRIIETSTHHDQESAMRAMAILSVLVGAFEIANAMVEFWASRSNAGGASTVLGVTIGIIAAVLLMIAGLTLLRRGWRAATWARIAAVVYVAMLILIRMVQPWMSAFSTLIGVAFPVALLVFLFASRPRGPSTPMVT